MEKARVELHNQSDAWIWITAYTVNGATRHPYDSFCVGPHRNEVHFVKRGYLDEIRGEVTHKNCAHPVMLDRTLGYDGKAPYYLTGSNGTYKFWHTP